MIFKNFKYFFLFTASLLIIKGHLKKNQLSKKKIHLIHADLIQKKGVIDPDALFLSGNVSLEHQGNTLDCDSAVYYKKSNEFKGFGQVKMHSKDRRFTGEKLEYDGNSGIAKVYEKPVAYEKETEIRADTLYHDSHTKISRAIGNTLLTDKNTRVSSSLLEYNGNNEQAYYTTGGTVYDEKNILKSLKGVYFSREKKAEFLSNVDIENQEYKILSHRAHYYTEEKKVDFLGPTTIRKKSKPQEYIYTEKGSYYTQDKKAYGQKAPSLHYNGKILKGDSLYFDQISGFGSATGNVCLEDPEKKRFLTGGYGEIYQPSDSAILLKKPLAIKLVKNDSIFIHADTLIAVKTIESTNVIRAYHFAKMYKTDMQAKCDSIVYHEDQGQMSFYKDPVFWRENQQIQGDMIHAYIHPEKEVLDSMQIIGNAFASSKVDSLNEKEFNQLKGRFMSAYFKNSQIDSIEAKGNAQSLFFAEEEDQRNKVKRRIGINRSNCGLILAWFTPEQKIRKVSCRQKAHSILSPEVKFPEQEHFLSHFQWRDKERPIKKEEIFIPDILSYRKEQEKSKKL
ncbi:OstA-like protein [Bacteroidetes bacterium endosymbiont of Geopemphigus sp.]|uniref:OstA-like protein n=1 Tax=Bacteroidetes bacterium endosymbiont of Geopemphigus sp. TaxID=2047937 RepID=UPI000CD199C0|nr:OstA-like protein [Bacteroidetes bacterium endosymbiont of Geopemphigus sp.]